MASCQQVLIAGNGDIIGEGGQWTMAHGGAEAAAMGFNAIHVDSMLWSVGLGLIFCWFFRSVAKKAETGRSQWYG